MYQNLDALDGKQARKLGLASPLGQLFDHGLDCFLSTFFLLNFMIIFKVSRFPIMVLMYLIGANIIFWGPNFAEFFTHILRTNHNNIGVTEIHITVILVNIITGIFGEGIWQNDVFGIPIAYLVATFFYVNIVLTIPPVLSEAWNAAKDKKQFKMMVIPMVTYLLSIVIMYVLVPEVFVRGKVSLVLMFSVTFNILTVKLITGSLTNMNYQIIHPEIVCIYLVIILLKVGFSPSIITLGAVLAIARLFLLAIAIIFDISNYLKIPIFIVPK